MFEIEQLINTDPVFKQILDAYGMPPFHSRPQGYETLCRIILEQQVSIDSAKATHLKILNGIDNFTPAELLNCSNETLRNFGVSRQKASYFKALAHAILNGHIDLDSFNIKSPDEVREELINIKGIGNWTIDVYLMFSLQAPDILPLGDIGILSAIRELWGLTTMQQIVVHTKKWAPYRTAASFFLWHYYLEKRGRKFPH